MAFRDRIKALKRVPASELVPNPRNWRTHSDEQRAALRGILEDVGLAGAALARQLEDGRYQLIDGHLRTEELGDQKIPVLILDVTEEEADKILVSADPLAAMAGADLGKLQELIDSVDGLQPDLEQSLLDLCRDAGISTEETATASGETIGKELPQALQLVPAREYAVIMCESADEWEQLKKALALRQVRRGGYKAGSAFDAVSTQRVVKAKKILELLSADCNS